MRDRHEHSGVLPCQETHLRLDDVARWAGSRHDGPHLAESDRAYQVHHHQTLLKDAAMKGGVLQAGNRSIGVRCVPRDLVTQPGHMAAGLLYHDRDA